MTAYEINGKEYEVDYDLDNRIIKADIDGEYRYDAFGRRVIRKEGSTKTALIWWSNSECAEYKHSSGQLDFVPLSLRQMVASPPRLQKRTRQGRYSVATQNDLFAHPSRLNAVIARAVDGSKSKLQWYHKNYLDHVYAVSDDDGDILEYYRYTAFGEVTIYNPTGIQQTTTQINNQILWNTRRRDTVSGYYMYKFRHYSAELGRWPARDPIEERGGVNLYGFVGNDGINRWDYLGMKELTPNSVFRPEPVQLQSPPANYFTDWLRNNHNPDAVSQDTPTHAQGLKSIKDGLRLLETACDTACSDREYTTECRINEMGYEITRETSIDANPEKCDKQKCKVEARKAVNAMAAAWSLNYGRGRHGNAGIQVAGYYCWDWAAIFIDALESQDLKCLKFAKGYATHKNLIDGHMYVKIWACREMAMFPYQVTFDDGCFGECSHAGIFPQPGNGYTDLSPPFPKPGLPYASFIPAPRNGENLEIIRIQRN